MDEGNDHKITKSIEIVKSSYQIRRWVTMISVEFLKCALSTQSTTTLEDYAEKIGFEKILPESSI